MTFYYKDKTLPNRFRECRLKSGLSQPDLSRALGFKSGKATVYCYEHNKRIPDLTILLKMKNVFHVSLDYLLCLDNYPSHIDYAKIELGFDEELIQSLLKIATNNELKYELNNFIQNKLQKEIYNYESKADKQ